MILCPVDLRVCELEACRSGGCDRCAAPPLAICWDCGGVSAEPVRTVVCVDCLLAYRQVHAQAEG